MRALAATAFGTFEVDLEAEEVLEAVDAVIDPPLLDVGLPLVVAADASGSTVIAVVDRRPPLMVSHDAGLTWREAGGGLPAGRAVAISPDDPDLILFASETRLYLSEDGGRFWRALTLELPEISAVAWATEA